jgi:hypothetical protein
MVDQEKASNTQKRASHGNSSDILTHSSLLQALIKRRSKPTTS